MMMPRTFGEMLFDDWFDEPFFGKRNPLYGKREKNLMKTDVRDDNDHYTVSVDLPGYKKEDVTAQLENGYLTISAQRGVEKDEEPKDQETGGYIRRERWTGACSRSFYVGDQVKETDIKAKMENGILTLIIPKTSELQPQQSRIAIEG